jgi:hypothetical protein
MRLYNTIPDLYILYKYYNYKINAYWPNSNHCHAHFLDLFENVANINFSSECLVVNSDLNLILRDENENSNNSFSKDQSLNFYKTMLKPKSFIVDDSLKLIKKYNLDKNTYGLYLRCPEGFNFKHFLNGETIPPDKIHNGKSQELINFLKFFENEQHLHDKRIMLISDSAILNDYLLSKYKNMFVIKENKLPNHGRHHPERNKDSIISALKCCFLLKSCTRLKGTGISAFSRLPEWLPEIN